jgi:hypothetical protein
VVREVLALLDPETHLRKTFISGYSKVPALLQDWLAPIPHLKCMERY